MDPNATLNRIRILTARMLADGAPESDDAAELAELVSALDSWILGGGFLPSDWAKGRE